ncbi:MAG: caspase domain-containing protein [Terriglobales bacterium]
MRAVLISLIVLIANSLSAQTFQRSYAIVIGVKTYQNFGNLPNAEADAESIATFLKTQNYQVIELYNKNAGRAEILDAMDEVSRVANDHDRVLVFFAGHGYTETRGGQDWGYIVPYDGRPNTVSTMIGMEELRTQSERMGKAHHQLFLMDSCYGGSIGMRDSPGGVDPRVPDYLPEISRRIAREALTAGGKDQRVEDGSKNGHSRFTAALLEALAEGKADLNSDGYITFSELSAYVIPRATSREQTPAPAWLPGHGLGEYWFTSPLAAKIVINAPPKPSEVRRDTSEIKGEENTENTLSTRNASEIKPEESRKSAPGADISGKLTSSQARTFDLQGVRGFVPTSEKTMAGRLFSSHPVLAIGTSTLTAQLKDIHGGPRGRRLRFCMKAK